MLLFGEWKGASGLCGHGELSVCVQLYMYAGFSSHCLAVVGGGCLATAYNMRIIIKKILFWLKCTSWHSLPVTTVQITYPGRSPVRVYVHLVSLSLFHRRMVPLMCGTSVNPLCTGCWARRWGGQDTCRVTAQRESWRRRDTEQPWRVSLSWECREGEREEGDWGPDILSLFEGNSRVVCVFQLTATLFHSDPFSV